VMEGSADTNHIERDLEHTRARLDRTIDALQHKLSPGQMVDEGLSWFKEGAGADFGRNLGRHVRDNPMPVALIGVGLAWLMVSSQRNRDTARDDWREQLTGDEAASGHAGYGRGTYGAGSYTSSTGEAGLSHQPLPYEAAAYDDLATKADEAGSRLERRTDETDEAYSERVYTAKGSVLGVTRQVGETMSTFRDRVESAISAAADRFRRMGHGASHMAGDAASTASSMTDRAGSLASEAAGRGRAGLRGLYGYGQSAAYNVREGAGYAAWRARDLGSRTADYFQEQPLAMAALGVTVGALLGMLVPRTRYEREMLGDMREGLRERAREAVSDLGQRAGRVAETVLDTAHEATRREGLTGMSPGGVAAAAREQVADAAGRVRAVVEETAAAGREALERELSGQTSEEGKPGNGEASATSAGTGRPSGEHGDQRPAI
jgi:ElaB/YqjD/DUF883 family membrane-anchored ribosome-binding protein